MNGLHQPAEWYLHDDDDGAWRWTEGGDVLVWRDGTTIAFRQEIRQILARLAPNGLPPFGSVVFLLAACRGKVPEPSEIISISDAPPPANMGDDALRLSTARAQLKVQLEAALAQLRKIARLPRELNSGLQAKCLLAEAVFDDVGLDRQHVDATEVLRKLNYYLPEPDSPDYDSGDSSRSSVRQIHVLSEGLKRHSPESLALRVRTGLDALPNEQDAEFSGAERARLLIKELCEDSEHAILGRAALQLLAAVRLPRRLGQCDDLAVGGVSDITNRGSLDRLLLSELANDDATLSARLALNEALYLRKEPPLREPPETLSLLLDSGVRMWGIPRLLATAVGLALMAQGKHCRKVQAWRARGSHLVPVDMLSRAGLTEHLGVLETHAHPGLALAAFSKMLAAESHNQSVIITESDVLEDADFRRLISEMAEPPGFIATVNRSGGFQLHPVPLSPRPALCQADLDLARIANPAPVESLLHADADPNLPAIFHVSPFPFLFQIEDLPLMWTKAGDGFVYGVMADRTLTRLWPSRGTGAVLADALPGGDPLFLQIDDTVAHMVLAGSGDQPACLVSVPLPDGAPKISALVNGPGVLAVHRYGDVIVLVRTHDIRAYSLAEGRLLDKIVNPCRWVHGRYLRGSSQFCFASWDGQSVKLEPLDLPSAYPAPAVALVFDRKLREGPWFLTDTGQVVSLSTGVVIHPRRINRSLDFALARVSRDGDRLLVPCARQTSNEMRQCCVYQIEGRNHPLLVEEEHAALEEFPPYPDVRIMECPQVEAIGAIRDGLAFQCADGGWWKIGLYGVGRIVKRPFDPGKTPLLLSAKFGSRWQKAKCCKLRLAEFPGGSKAYFDSRGLLHLQSSDSNLPQVSLMILIDNVAGWTSDRIVCGPQEFVDAPFVPQPQEVFDRIRLFLDRL